MNKARSIQNVSSANNDFKEQRTAINNQLDRLLI